MYGNGYNAVMVKTKVLFRMFKGEVLALFPRIAGTVGKAWHCSSYAHIGQHGAADVSIILDSRPATRKEYRPLAAELRRIGYRLDIRKRTTMSDLRERKTQLKRDDRRFFGN